MVKFKFPKNFWIGVTFLIPLALAIINPLIIKLPEIYQHLFLTLTAIFGVHLLDRIFFIGDTEKALKNLVSNVQKDIGDQTGSLLSMSKSLEVMDHCGIAQLYQSRVDAAMDISSDIIDPSNTKIRIMGISLNDFVQGMDVTLVGAWKTIQQFVLGERQINDPSKGLDIRCLIIDPFCFGAVLRSESESEASSAIAKRLEQDVNAAARDLQKLSKAANYTHTKVKFECKMYRLPPILFLSWTDSGCYVQQYHFWSSRDNRTPIPVLKYRSLPTTSITYPYHKEMEHHFEWIWQNASVSLDEYIVGNSIGIDKGMQECGAINIFTNKDKGFDRIAYLLKKADQNVSIQGISLNSFFKVGQLRELLSGILADDKVNLEVLLLDPDSHQAKLRSYRERLFEAPDQSYDDYILNDHFKSDLYHDTNRTMDYIKQMLSDLRRKKGAAWIPKIRVRKYDSAPACFILRVDGHILVEQYHYGKISTEMRSILGKDMPLVEYLDLTDQQSSLYTSDPFRQPFGLLVDHFRYAFGEAREVVVV